MVKRPSPLWENEETRAALPSQPTRYNLRPPVGKCIVSHNWQLVDAEDVWVVNSSQAKEGKAAQ
jgi:hypothetical protein